MVDEIDDMVNVTDLMLQLAEVDEVVLEVVVIINEEVEHDD